MLRFRFLKVRTNRPENKGKTIFTEDEVKTMIQEYVSDASVNHISHCTDFNILTVSSAVMMQKSHNCKPAEGQAVPPLAVRIHFKRDVISKWTSLKLDSVSF